MLGGVNAASFMAEKLPNSYSDCLDIWEPPIPDKTYAPKRAVQKLTYVQRSEKIEELTPVVFDMALDEVIRQQMVTVECYNAGGPMLWGTISPQNRLRRPSWGVRVQLYSFFNLDTRCAWVVKATPWPLYPREKDSVLIVQVARWVPERSGRVRNILPPHRDSIHGPLNPQPVAISTTHAEDLNNLGQNISARGKAMKVLEVTDDSLSLQVQQETAEIWTVENVTQMWPRQ